MFRCPPNRVNSRRQLDGRLREARHGGQRRRVVALSGLRGHGRGAALDAGGLNGPGVGSGHGRGAQRQGKRGKGKEEPGGRLGLLGIEAPPRREVGAQWARAYACLLLCVNGFAGSLRNHNIAADSTARKAMYARKRARARDRMLNYGMALRTRRSASSTALPASARRYTSARTPSRLRATERMPRTPSSLFSRRVSWSIPVVSTVR